ncbi:HECT-type E3 ubiquitin transferase [Malassezia cuniculi]|uniref:HECT-type E3 ubiquitin transferase n=1 Tax=Malassezia cuniculi TaxID=948313 RepID=A0AAF0ERF4_9BASI|nr:HECT-type E3 ubiquitin transferase [Malassezia cuniculi]
MKITKTPKRQPEVVPEVASLCATLTETPEAELSGVIAQLPYWTWPRGDLYTWVPVLNRFDEIMERIIAEHDMVPFQQKAFAPETKELLLHMLTFSRLLLENCMNRKLYASIDRVDKLLATDDMEVLEAALYLLLRPAQQLSGPGSSRHDLGVPRNRLSTLAVVWPVREAGIELSEAVGPSPRALQSINYSYYIRCAPDAPSQNIPVEGSVRVSIRDLHGSAQSKMAEVDRTNMSPEEQFELFHRVRIGLAFGNADARRRAVTCRLLSIACYSHAVSQGTANSQLFLYEPGIVQHIAALISSSDAWLTAVSLYALEGLGHHRNHLQELLSAVNASVSHGILLQTLQEMIGLLQNGFSCSQSDADAFIDSMISLVAFITTTVSGGSMVIGAGLIPQLVTISTIVSHDNYLVQRTSTRAIGLLDSIIYGYAPAFDVFCAANGVEKLVGRVSEEVNSAIKEAQASSVPYRLAYGRVALLRIILKLFAHLMTTPGTGEGLRNLIDTPLTPSLRLIMEHHTLFGSHTLAHAINITAIFVHNEPTLLPIIQEKRLFEAFLGVMHEPLDASFEVLTAATTAVGALSLNDAGIKVLTKEPVVSALISCLGHSTYTRVLLERDNANLFGSAFDELVRHHPNFRKQVSEAVLGVIDSIINEGRQYNPPEDEEVRSQFGLVPAEAPSIGQPIVREEDTALDSTDNVGQISRDPPQPVVLMDVLCRFLEGLLRNPSHAVDFVEIDGLVRLVPFYGLPCLPYNFAASASADSYVSVLRHIIDVNPTAVAVQLLKELSAATTAAMSLLAPSAEGTSRIASLLSLGDVNEANAAFRTLVNLCARVHLISDMFQTFSSGEQKVSLTFLEVAADNSFMSIGEIGELLRTATWEAMLFKAAVSGINEDSSPLGRNVRALRYVATQTPAALRSFIGEIVSLTMQRRVFKPHYFRKSISAAESCAKMLISYLEPRTGASRENTFAELSHNIAFVASMLFDFQGKSVVNIYTVVLVAFEKAGGLASLGRIVKSCRTEMPTAEGALRTHLVGSLRATLSIFRHLAEAQKISPSIRDLPICEGEANAAPPVDAIDFAVTLRSAAYDIFVDMLKEPWLKDLPIDVVRLFLSTLHVMSVPESLSMSQKARLAPFDQVTDELTIQMLFPFVNMVATDEPFPEVDQDALENLVNMGFGRLGAHFALWRTNGDLSMATTFLLSHNKVAQFSGEISPELQAQRTKKKEFEHKCKTTLPRILERAIQLSETHGQVAFEIRDITNAIVKSNKNAGECFELVTGTLDYELDTLASRLHAAVLLFSNTTVQQSLPWDVVCPFGYRLIDLVLAKGREWPKWISAALLCLCFVYGMADVPPKVDILSRTDIMQGETSGPLLSPDQVKLRDHFSSLLDYLLWCLDQEMEHSDRLAVFRLACVITRRSENAVAFVEKGGVQKLLHAFNTRDLSSISGCQKLVMIVLRHIAEVGSTLSATMRTEVSCWVHQKLHPRSSDGGSFSRGMAFASLRDPEAFLESAMKIVKVNEMRTGGESFLALQDEQPPLEAEPGYDAAVHVLLDELYEVAQQLPEEAPASANEDAESKMQTDDADDASEDKKKSALVAAEDARKGYAIFIMQCLTELLQSYIPSKHSFLVYSRDGKSALSLFLTDLVPAGFVHGRSKEGLRLRMAVSNWAMSAVVALGSGDIADTEKEVPPLVVSARKSLLDGLCRALKDTTTSSEQIEIRYGRLYALSDLCSRLIAPRPNGRDRKLTQELSLHMAKTMLEKNFVNVLTTALSHVDLGLPSVKALLDSILRPLELLTAVANKMAKARRDEPVEDAKLSESDSYSDATDVSDEYGSVQSFSDEEDSGDAPDFYRNSALGMHTGEMEQGHYDEEMSDSEEEVEVEEYTDSEEHSELSTDMESLDGDSTHVVEVMDEDDDDDDDEHDDDDDDDDDEGTLSEGSDSDEGDFYDDDELEFEGNPESINVGPMSDSVSGLLAALDNMGDSGIIEPEDDEAEDFFSEDIGQLEIEEDMPGDDNMQAPWPGRRIGRDQMNPFVVHHPAPGVAHGVRVMSPGSWFNMEPSDPAQPSHPLLQDENTRRRRAMNPGYTDWTRSVENLVGGGTMQFLEMLLNSATNAGADTSIRIEIPEHGHGTQRINISNVPHGQSDTQGQNGGLDIIRESQQFTTENTRNRWNDEMLLLHAQGGTDRGDRFRAHLINKLSPEYFENQRREEQAKLDAIKERNRRQLEEKDSQRQREQEAQRLRESKERLEQLEIEANRNSGQDAEMEPAETSSARNEAQPRESQAQAQAQSQSQDERVTVQVRGLTVDLTGTGVDPTFLEALPDDLREEALLSQNLGDRLAQASGASLGIVPGSVASLGIVPDFLNALPPELRAELTRHTERTPRREQTEETISPPNPPRESPPVQPSHAFQPFKRKPAPPRDAIQLLDRAGIATLVRLLYFPEMSTRQSSLYKILVHLSENSRSRTELLNLLLMVLADGTADAMAVERSFSAMSSRASRGVSTPTRNRRGMPNMPETPGTPSSAPISIIGNEAPGLVAQRSVEALCHLTQANSQAALYFLREDVRAPKKAKSRERAEMAEKGSAPVNVLLGLLQKDSILNNSQLVDAVISLINGVTKPLDDFKEEEESDDAATHNPAAEESTAGSSAAGTSNADATLRGPPATPSHETPSKPLETPGAAEDPLALVRAPHIPHECLEAVVRPLTTAISSRGFQQTLSVFLHLSHISGAREVISKALQRLANSASASLVNDLDGLISSLPPAAEEDAEEDAAELPLPAAGTARLQSAALTKLASPASAQAVFLRSLRALEYLYVGR